MSKPPAKVSILVPFRDADGSRTRAKEWMMRRWAHFWPDAEIIEETDDGLDPFNKSMAVNRAADRAAGDVFILLDADSWVPVGAIRTAVDLVGRGAPWVVPVFRNFRMSRAWSEMVMRGDPTAPLPRVRSQDCDTSPGPVVGFCHVMTRQAFQRVGMDERIRGWGGEDSCFVRAMDVVNGKHARLRVFVDEKRQRQPAIVVCLWHERPRDEKRRQRIWLGQDLGNEEEKHRVTASYRTARSKEAMLRVLAEARAARVLP